jgi:hypothetical protein
LSAVETDGEFEVSEIDGWPGCRIGNGSVLDFRGLGEVLGRAMLSRFSTQDRPVYLSIGLGKHPFHSRYRVVGLGLRGIGLTFGPLADLMNFRMPLLPI